jgi:hypothetical protein
MGYNQDYEKEKRKWTKSQHFINNVMWIALTPVILVLLPAAAIWNQGDPFRQKNVKHNVEKYC